MEKRIQQSFEDIPSLLAHPHQYIVVNERQDQLENFAEQIASHLFPDL